MKRLLALILWEILIILISIAIGNNIHFTSGTTEEVRIAVALFFSISIAFVSTLGVIAILKAKVL